MLLNTHNIQSSKRAWEMRMTQSLYCRKNTSIELVTKHNRDSERCFQRGAKNMMWMQRILEHQLGISHRQEQMVIRPEGWRAFQAGPLYKETYQVGKCFWKSCSFSLTEARCTRGGWGWRVFVDISLGMHWGTSNGKGECFIFCGCAKGKEWRFLSRAVSRLQINLGKIWLEV